MTKSELHTFGRLLAYVRGHLLRTGWVHDHRGLVSPTGEMRDADYLEKLVKIMPALVMMIRNGWADDYLTDAFH